jgi:hypothetical protein
LFSISFWTESYFVFNNYGFFATLTDSNVPLNFVLYQSKTGFTDNGLFYQNIFDAQFDGLLWAMEKAGVKDLPIVSKFNSLLVTISSFLLGVLILNFDKPGLI